LAAQFSRVARFFLVRHTKNGGKYIKGSKNIPNVPNGRKIYPKKIFQHLPSLRPPKFTQIGIFFLKIYHLATLQFSQDFRSETEILQKELGKKLTMDFVDIYLIFIGNGDTVPQIFGYRM
jgi:hypothetical protein